MFEVASYETATANDVVPQQMSDFYIIIIINNNEEGRAARCSARMNADIADDGAKSAHKPGSGYRHVLQRGHDRGTQLFDSLCCWLSSPYAGYSRFSASCAQPRLFAAAILVASDTWMATITGHDRVTCQVISWGLIYEVRFHNIQTKKIDEFWRWSGAIDIPFERVYEDVNSTFARCKPLGTRRQLPCGIYSALWLCGEQAAVSSKDARKCRDIGGMPLETCNELVWIICVYEFASIAAQTLIAELCNSKEPQCLKK